MLSLFDLIWTDAIHSSINIGATILGSKMTNYIAIRILCLKKSASIEK
jgi:hypothetical protein